MSEQLIVTSSILIDALPERVWEVLITREYIKQWDDLPEDFGHEDLYLGCVIEWPGYALLTVINFEPAKQLKISLYDPKWEQPPSAYHIAYTYTLTEENSQTILMLVIGDFGQVNNGEAYYDASAEFANKATLKIKELAES